MEIHWLADICAAGAIFLLAQIAVRLFRRTTPAPSGPDMRRSRLLAALDGTRTGTWVWDLRSRQFLCDTRACHNLGVRAGTILTLEDLLSCVEPSDRSRVEYQLIRATEYEEPFELVARIRTSTAAERYIQLEGQPENDSRGAPFRISGTLRDVTNQRRRNIELRRHAQILYQVHDAIFAAAPDGRILTWNEGAYRVYGYSADEAIGRQIEMLWFPEDLPLLKDRISETSLASGPREFVSRVRHKSGQELMANFRLALLRDADGIAIGLLACSHDVTEQQRKHELLSLQASALESIGDAVIVVNRFATVQHANDAAVNMFSPTPILGQRITRFMAGERRCRRHALRRAEASLKQQFRWSGTMRFCRAPGEAPFVARASIAHLDLPSGPSWVCVLHDLTAQRRSEAALRERERRFRNLADSAPMMVWITNLEGASEYVNRAWLSLTGMTRAQAAGFGWQEAIHPDDRAQLKRLLDGREGGQTPFEIELRMNSADGGVAYTLTRGAPRYEAGKLVGFVGSAVDISNIKRAEQERIELEQQALKSQKLHSLGVMAGGIAHDFNNLLVSVLGFSDLALRELDPRHPAWEFVKQIELGSRRAAALVEQVLTFAGKARKGEEEVDLNETVLEMVHLLETTVGRTVVVDLDLAKDLPPLIGDPAQLGQVVMNLVLNAADALGDKGGRVRVRTSTYVLDGAEKQAWGSDHELPNGEYLQIEVHDAGCGMNEETLSQIFDPFFTTKRDGRGLGLSAVMGVVRSHGGAVAVNSDPGQGSVFRVLLPLARPSLGTESLAPPRMEGEQAVLVIDDDQTVRQATRRMLQSGGLRVYCAQSESEALAIYRQRSREIKLVILDVVMPDTNPQRVAVGLREIRSDVRILLASGFSESDLRPDVDGKSFHGFVPKPYDRAQLLDAAIAACPSLLPELSGDAAHA